MEEPIRVALDATALGSGRGGDETYVRGLLRGLAETNCVGDEVRVYARRNAEMPQHPMQRIERLRIGGSARLLGSLSLRALRFDGLFVGYTHLPLAVRRPAALVVTDLSFRHQPEQYPACTRQRLNALVSFQARRAGGVITLSEFCRRDLVDTYDLDPESVHVVPATIDPPRSISENEQTALDRWARGRGIDGSFLLYLGNLHPRKNVALLVRAFTAAALPGLQLVIAGSSWWSGGGEELAVREAPDGSVVVLGHVDDLERAYLLSHAHALAYPSLFEGFGLPPVEAMSVGTPVLASRAAAIPETCGDAALLVDARSLDALIAGIEKIVHDESCRERLRELGPARAAAFSAQRTGRAARRAILRSTAST